MKLSQGILAGLLVVSLVQAAEPAQNHFRFWKPINRTAAKDEEIDAFVLDSDVYAATRNDFPDIRVLDNQSVEVPCQIESDVEYREEKSRDTVNVKIVSVQPDGDALVIRVRLPDNTSADGLIFSTPLTNYECKILISGSTDGTTWTPLVTDGVIFDFSRYMDVNNREIALPSNNFREFKIAIADVTDEKESALKELTRTFQGSTEEQRTENTTVERRPFRIDKIEAWNVVQHERVQQPKTAAYPVVGFEAKDDPAGKRTLVTVRTHREPITRLTLETPGRNFSRSVVVEAPAANGPNPQWRSIGEGTISNFSFRNLHRESLSIIFPEQREAQFRIVIRNEDNPPITVTGVKAVGGVYRVVFLAQPEKTYRVFYGSPTAAAPSYEAGAVLGTLRQNYQPVAVALGPEAANTVFNAEPTANPRRLLDNWAFLGTAIGVMVAVLAWALFRAGKRMETISNDDADHS